MTAIRKLSNVKLHIRHLKHSAKGEGSNAISSHQFKNRIIRLYPLTYRYKDDISQLDHMI